MSSYRKFIELYVVLESHFKGELDYGNFFESLVVSEVSGKGYKMQALDMHEGVHKLYADNKELMDTYNGPFRDIFGSTENFNVDAAERFFMGQIYVDIRVSELEIEEFKSVLKTDIARNLIGRMFSNDTPIRRVLSAEFDGDIIEVSSVRELQSLEKNKRLMEEAEITEARRILEMSVPAIIEYTGGRTGQILRRDPEVEARERKRIEERKAIQKKIREEKEARKLLKIKEMTRTGYHGYFRLGEEVIQYNYFDVLGLDDLRRKILKDYGPGTVLLVAYVYRAVQEMIPNINIEQPVYYRYFDAGRYRVEILLYGRKYKFVYNNPTDSNLTYYEGMREYVETNMLGGEVLHVEPIKESEYIAPNSNFPIKQCTFADRKNKFGSYIQNAGIRHFVSKY